MLLFPVTGRRPADRWLYVEVAVERTVSVIAVVFDIPSVKAAGPIREFSKNGPLGSPGQRRHGDLHHRIARADVDIVVVRGERTRRPPRSAPARSR